MIVFDQREHKILSEHKINNASLLNRFDGGNSNILHFASSNSEFALKIYLGDKERKNRSLMHEIEAFRVLSKIKNINIPKLFSVSSEIPSICYEWVPGEHPKENINSKRALVDCLCDLRKLSSRDLCEIIAVDGIKETNDILKQLEDRYYFFKSINNLPKEILDLCDEIFFIVKDRLKKNFSLELNTLSFSDVGLHNVIADARGTYTFIDFEFFGLDSIVKVICDLYTHPRGIFSSDELSLVSEKLNISSYEIDVCENVIPAIALKWFFIIIKRYVDLDNYFDFTVPRGIENPKLMLDYALYLTKIESISTCYTFSEFKSVR